MEMDNRFFIDLGLREIVKQFSGILNGVMSNNYGIHWNEQPLINYNRRVRNIHHISTSSIDDPVTILTLLSNADIINLCAIAGFTNWTGWTPQIVNLAHRIRGSRNDWAHFDPAIANNRNVRGFLASCRRLFEITEMNEGIEEIDRLIELQRRPIDNTDSTQNLTEDQKAIEDSLANVQEDESDMIENLVDNENALREFQRKVVEKYKPFEVDSQIRNLLRDFLHLHVRKTRGEFTLISETDYATIDSVLKAFLQDESLLYPGETKSEDEDLQRLTHYNEQLKDVFESFKVWVENFNMDI